MSASKNDRRWRCRTCTNNHENMDFHPLSQYLVEYDKTWTDLLLYICRIDAKIMSIELPTAICGSCTKQLQNAYNFVQQAQNANEEMLAMNSNVEKNKHTDCLTENPIDYLPSDPVECVQVKMEEVDVKEQNSSTDSFSIKQSVNEKPLIDATDSKEIEDNEINGVLTEFEMKNVTESVDLHKEEFSYEQEAGPSSSNTNFLNLDPITVAETHWDSTQSENSFPIDKHNQTQESESESDTPLKNMRKPGRPRAAKYRKMCTNNDGRYTCDVCGKTFAWKKDLLRHSNSHFGTHEFSCELCNRKFLRKDKLNDHMKTHGKTVIENQLRKNRHSEWNFAERLYTEQKFSLIQCKLCNNKYNRTNDLRLHIMQHLQPYALDFDINKDVIKLFPQTANSAEIKASIRADIDKKHLSKYYAIINVNGYEMCLSDSDGVEEADNSDLTTHVNPKYKCELCRIAFTRKYQIISHSRYRHANEILPFKCTVCKLGFVCEEIYEMHINTQCRSKEKKYQCLKCPGKFMWLENLEGHKCSNRFNTPEYKATLPHKRELRKCNICDKTFVWFKDLKRHMESHNADANLYECSICFQRFREQKNLRNHIRKEHEQIKSIQCGLCDKNFEKLSHLRKHLNEHADGITGVKSEQTLFFKIYNAKDNTTAHELSTKIAADFVSKKLSCYYSAVDNSGNELSLDDSQTDDSADDKDSIEYECNLCQQKYKRRKFLLLHQYKEHKIESCTFACENCEKKFVCKALLEQHLKRDCLNEQKKFQCEKCQTRFVWQKNLKLHYQLKHNDPEQRISKQLANKLQCDLCDKVFIWPKDLTRHKRVHMPDDEKYSCPFCNRKFNRKDNMTAHLKIHGNNTNLLPLNKKDFLRAKSIKISGIDENLCKPNGCKLIQCMICLSKHTKIFDLRNHLNNHQTINFMQRQLPIDEISQLLYPNEPLMNEQILIERIYKDIEKQNYDHLYSITNEVGYELSIESSETDSDSDLDDSEFKTANLVTLKNYVCDLCGECFKRKYKIFEHQLHAHKWYEAPHVCEHCDIRFLSIDLLKSHHASQCKNMRKRFICRKCPRRFMWKDNLKIHLRTIHAEIDDAKNLNEARIFECIQCNRNFQSLKDLTRHMVMHRNESDLFKCFWCPRKFSRGENLHMHMTRHGVTKESLETAKCILKATITANGPKKILCKACNLQFSNIAALRAHIRQPQHPPSDSNINYSIMNSVGFEMQIDDSETDDENENRRQYTCILCNLTCKRKYELGKHQHAMHKPESLPLKCDKCIFKTVSHAILSHHMETQCFDNEKQYECNKCYFKFMWPENLQIHEKLLHNTNDDTSIVTADGTVDSNVLNSSSTVVTNVNVFQCDQCGRKYTRKDRLTAHIKKMHTDNTGNVNLQSNVSLIDPITGEKLKKKPPTEKKFLCAFCGRAVTSSSNLIIHMRRHTGEKPFKCDFCDMAFPRSSDLQCHRRKHTGEKPHKCTVCEKAFSRSYKLQTHMRIHSGERPYKCTYCDKCFTQSNDLTLHIRRHTGERPYVCGICGERFIQGTALRNHRTLRGHYEDEGPKRTSLLQQF